MTFLMWMLAVFAALVITAAILYWSIQAADQVIELLRRLFP